MDLCRPLSPSENKKPIWTLVLNLVLALGFTGAVSGVLFISQAVRQLQAEGAPTDGPALTKRYLALLAQPSGAALALWIGIAGWTLFALLGARLGQRDVLGRLAARPPKSLWKTSVLTLLGMLCVGRLGLALARALGLQPGMVLRLLGQMMGTAHDSGAGVWVWAGAAFTGVAEELYFRGFLQTRLVERWGGWGVVLSALAFGAVHADPLHSPVAFGFGLVLGVAARRCGSVLPGAVAHALNNLLAVQLMGAPLGLPVWVSGLVCAVLLVGAMLALARLHPWPKPATSDPSSAP